MLNIDSGRVTDPTTLTSRELVEVVKDQGNLVVQFSKADTCLPFVLRPLNEACGMLDDRLQVRFYGHYGSVFDCRLLRMLPNVKNLAVDCVFEVLHEDEIGRLAELKRLSFGVFEFDRPNFLETLDVSRLKVLVLSENRKRNIDLKPLRQCSMLETLYINGHSKGIEAIGQLRRLNSLTLSAYAKRNALGFVKSIPHLRQLTLHLGGRVDIEDLSSDTIEVLQILRVRGLATIGNLNRFPALSALRIEDQIHLSQIDLSGSNLERLWFYNCKNLRKIHALKDQNRLREFFASKVAIDLDELLSWDWFTTTRSVTLCSSSQKWNADAAAQLAARGLAGKHDYWP